jgi:hypothetical protein
VKSPNPPRPHTRQVKEFKEAHEGESVREALKELFAHPQ